MEIAGMAEELEHLEMFHAFHFIQLKDVVHLETQDAYAPTMRN